MEFSEPKGIYLQISDQIRERILQGDWQPGERISSIRELAVELGVNPNTVTRSYQTLMDREIIINQRGRGYFVSDNASERVLDEIKVYVRGDRLRLDRGSSGRWWGRNERTIRADIVMPELEELKLAGASHLELSGFDGSRLEVDIAGAIFLEGRDGRYDELDLSVAGASKIDLQGIVVTRAEVDLAGASDVTLYINGGELSGSLAGVGQIEYYGSVSDEDIDIAGFGRVNRVE